MRISNDFSSFNSNKPNQVQSTKTNPAFGKILPGVNKTTLKLFLPSNSLKAFEDGLLLLSEPKNMIYRLNYNIEKTAFYKSQFEDLPKILQANGFTFVGKFSEMLDVAQFMIYKIKKPKMEASKRFSNYVKWFEKEFTPEQIASKEVVYKRYFNEQILILNNRSRLHLDTYIEKQDATSPIFFGK